MIILAVFLSSPVIAQTPVNEWIWVEQSRPSSNISEEYLVMVTVLSTDESEQNPMRFLLGEHTQSIISLLDDGLITLEEFQLLTRTREAEGREIESFDALKKRLESKKGK